MSSVNGAISSTRRPAIQANNFEIKPAIIQMIQQTVYFGGYHKRILILAPKSQRILILAPKSQEDPNTFAYSYLKLRFDVRVNIGNEYP